MLKKLIILSSVVSMHILADNHSDPAWQKYESIKQEQQTQEAIGQLYKKGMKAYFTDNQKALFKNCLDRDCGACKELVDEFLKKYEEDAKVIDAAAQNGKKLDTILKDSTLNHEDKKALLADYQLAAMSYEYTLNHMLPEHCAIYIYLLESAEEMLKLKDIRQKLTFETTHQRIDHNPTSHLCRGYLIEQKQVVGVNLSRDKAWWHNPWWDGSPNFMDSQDALELKSDEFERATASNSNSIPVTLSDDDTWPRRSWYLAGHIYVLEAIAKKNIWDGHFGSTQLSKESDVKLLCARSGFKAEFLKRMYWIKINDLLYHIKMVIQKLD